MSQQQPFRPPQRVDLYAPMEAAQPGPPPLVLRVVVTPNVDGVVGGVPMSNRRVEPYVLLSSLPDEIRQRVELAIQARLQAM